MELFGESFEKPPNGSMPVTVEMRCTFCGAERLVPRAVQVFSGMLQIVLHLQCQACDSRYEWAWLDQTKEDAR